MNTGIIASRYAEALLRYAEENGDADVVYSQAESVWKSFTCSPKFRAYMESQAWVSLSAKMKALNIAAGGMMCPSLSKFMRLVIRNGRMQYLQYILYYYRMRYLKAKNIMSARLIMSSPSLAFEERLKEMFKGNTGATLSLETRIDPDLIGGFVLEIGGKRIDASISTQIAELRKQFIQKNERLV